MSNKENEFKIEMYKKSIIKHQKSIDKNLKLLNEKG